MIGIKVYQAARIDYQNKLKELCYKPFGNYIETYYIKKAE